MILYQDTKGENSSLALNGAIVPISDYPESVSYTHLDVYKRQDEHGAHELDVQVQRALTRAHEPAQHARRKAVGLSLIPI